jgi:Rrf2 family protein
MRLTYKGDYSIKIILELAMHHGKGVMTIQELSQKGDVPIKFLEQVLLDLKRGGFVESKRGKKGGYELAKRPDQIRLGEIVRYIDGPTEPIACVSDRYKGCKEADRCVLRGIWQRVDGAISGIIDNITFEDLAQQSQRQRLANDYSI